MLNIKHHSVLLNGVKCDHSSHVLVSSFESQFQLRL